MSKRRPGLKPRDRDDWPTPWPAVVPLLKLLEPRTKFIEPVAALASWSSISSALAMSRCGLRLADRSRTASYAIEPDTIFVTNLPWRRQFGMNDIIVNLSDQRPLWGLVYADWLFTSRATPCLPRLRAVAAVGRVKWIANSPHAGMENCCWCLFGRPRPDAVAAIRFIGRIGPARIDSTRRTAA